MNPRCKYKAQTIKLLGENIGRNFCDYDLCKECLGIVSNICLIKERIIWNVSKLKTAFQKYIIKNNEDTCHLMSYTSNKGFLSRMYKELSIFRNKKANIRIKNVWVTELVEYLIDSRTQLKSSSQGCGVRLRIEFQLLVELT